MLIIIADNLVVPVPVSVYKLGCNRDWTLWLGLVDETEEGVLGSRLLPHLHIRTALAGLKLSVFLQNV